MNILILKAYLLKDKILRNSHVHIYKLDQNQLVLTIFDE